MEFNVSTFVFEIINFLILIWILQRLFYRPVLEIITRRKLQTEQTLADAQALRQQADALRNRYENRQNHWEQEKQAALSALHQQIEAERKVQIDKLQSDLELERQKANVTLTRQQRELRQQVEKQALQNGARFAGILLQQAAGPELEARLFAMLMDNLTTLPEACSRFVQTLEDKQSVTITVTSTRPLTADQQQHLQQQLGSLINSQINFHYIQDAGLIAGLRLDIGSWVLHVNLQHELAGFAEIAHEIE